MAVVFLGDNIYADSTDMTVLRRKYVALKTSRFFQALKDKATILATWDDHDYGANDAGAGKPLARKGETPPRVEREVEVEAERERAVGQKLPDGGGDHRPIRGIGEPITAEAGETYSDSAARLRKRVNAMWEALSP